MADSTAQQSETTDAQDEQSERGLTDAVAGLTERLESVESDDFSDMSDIELVEARSHLKELEEVVEDVRKQQADAELDTRVDVGEKLYGLTRVESHTKYVTDDPSTVVARAVANGMDIDSFVSIKASALADEDEEIAEIKESEYTYYR
jgi:bifunctional N-acetylglucosamine-1-phosphate-uridyltransferase/glucosamine-1-phosphate-acetyltransferase GlmU-like protein